MAYYGIIMKKALLTTAIITTALIAEVPPLKPVNSGTFTQSQYIPDISLILDASLVARNKKQSDLDGLGIPGLSESFYTGHSHEGHDHGALNANNGFNFNYAELVLSSNVDPYFSMDAVFHFSEEGVEVEEGYFSTSALGHGLRVRGGKFLSELGRMNSQHHHAWDFSDAPLIYTSFLGAEGLGDLGLQLHYVLPTETYVMLGLEALQGRSETSFGNEAIDINGTTVDAPTPPSLVVGYIKSSIDIGDTVILPGLSYAYGATRSQHTHDGHQEAFSGHTSLYNAELTIKHYFDSYSFLQWQSEWMMRYKSGDALHVEPTGLEIQDQTIKQSGLYTQLIYAQDQNWRYGLRYDTIYQNDFSFQEESLPSTPYQRYTGMVEYHFSEFSRLRLQYDYNDAVYGENETTHTLEQQNIQTIMLSFNLSIGAHAAHNF